VELKVLFDDIIKLSKWGGLESVNNILRSVDEVLKIASKEKK
jgi:hypothetical protein